MRQRTLGQGLSVAELGLGCMGMSQSYGTPDDEESVATIHRALELGVTLFDTAEAYGPYTNEALLGRALEGRRDRAIVATKFGYEIGRKDRGGLDSRPSHIREAVVPIDQSRKDKTRCRRRAQNQTSLILAHLKYMGTNQLIE